VSELHCAGCSVLAAGAAVVRQEGCWCSIEVLRWTTSDESHTLGDIAAANAGDHDEPLVFESIGNGVDSKQITPKDTAIVKCVVADYVACTACLLHRSISKQT
jgi:hypothetical protein